MVEIALLVQCASFGEKFERRIPAWRLIQFTSGDRKIELREVVAIKMPYQVRSAEMHYSINAQHSVGLPSAGAGLHAALSRYSVN